MNGTISNLTQVIESNSSVGNVVVGDFNLQDIQWDTLSSTSYAFSDFDFDESLTQPTHVQGIIIYHPRPYAKRLHHQSNCSLQYQLDNHGFIVTFQLSQQVYSPPTTTSMHVFDYPKANYDEASCHIICLILTTPNASKVRTSN